MNTWIDVNVWSGQFPFRRVAGTTVLEIETHLGGIGFGGVVVSPLEAIFQEDSYGAEEALAHELSARADVRLDVWHFKVVNPVCNWWERDLRRAVAELGVSGIRLCPTFHGYRFEDAVVTQAMEAAARLALPVQIMCKMQDWRIQWFFHAADVEAEQVESFLARFRGQPLILSGLHNSDMIRLAAAVNPCPCLLLDTSRLKGPWRTFETLTEHVDPARLCFGSLWPINVPECPLTQLEHARVKEELKAGILADNARGLLGR